MANRDAAMGFRLSGRTGSGGFVQLRKMKKDASESSAFFPGDVVALETDNGLTRTITPGTTIISGVNQTFGLTLTATEHLVCEQPDAVYQAQADGSLLEADMGLNANCILGTGEPTLLQSRDELDSTTEHTSATRDFKLIDRILSPDNDWGEFVKLLVIFNAHRMNPGATGV